MFKASTIDIAVTVLVCPLGDAGLVKKDGHVPGLQVTC